MTMWELAAAIEGWNSTQGGEGSKPPLKAMSPEEFDVMVEDHREQANR